MNPIRYMASWRLKEFLSRRSRFGYVFCGPRMPLAMLEEHGPSLVEPQDRLWAYLGAWKPHELTGRVARSIRIICEHFLPSWALWENVCRGELDLFHVELTAVYFARQGMGREWMNGLYIGQCEHCGTIFWAQIQGPGLCDLRTMLAARVPDADVV